MLLGLTKTGYLAYRKQAMFTVHFVRRNPAVSLCRARIPYRQNFDSLPRNAVFCEVCRGTRIPHVFTTYARGEEEAPAERQGPVPTPHLRHFTSRVRRDA